METKTTITAQLSFADESEEYRAFVDKFKPKKTTDDCYTPQPIYDVILGYVVDRYGIDPEKVVRPFWPGGDYTREEYPQGCTVVDNPPFSILSQIVTHYLDHGVSFFLFAPTLTAFSGRSHVLKVNHLICGGKITYENGAVVNTSFVTNLGDGKTVVESCPELRRLISAKDDEIQKANAKALPKYEYPDNVLTAAKVQWFAAHNTPYFLDASECCPIAVMDAQRAAGVSGIFGGGLLLSERAAAERAAAERAAAERWQLSDRERKMVAMLGGSR